MKHFTISFNYHMYLENRIQEKKKDKINILFKTSEVIVINRKVIMITTLEKTSKNEPRTNAGNAIPVSPES